jgi:hypothetical protein
MHRQYGGSQWLRGSRVVTAHSTVCVSVKNNKSTHKSEHTEMFNKEGYASLNITCSL